ncbi:UNVERIFIED_ORG: hypothetical protein J2806_000331 [Kosakonia oryzae]|uniref:Uncharacterized protein n=1 Tax=Kosakonia radicincitans TaxID=283686 RepID=A0AAX2EML4_9ENTR|nr:hypothetical protein [Kosakonia radicincitans]MDP9564698.1 hypothetical protein [Kosakonia oryzae]SFD97629.1 hypothetical protein SAMN03159468_00683 [Kosakonia radicincitans]SFQ99361.1 hypothetical protein SAMN03159514_00682 [Kosakonia radicincitans]SFT45997.1 hypothetical protein SAMN03159428_00680 [Kosakonia radicincitans]SFX16495.1 hypothetical protein SAMN03159436_00679 [Kosakonia radicincitans]
MNSSEIEQLTDELIGVAVLSLLKDNSPISTQALINQLRSMERNETDIERRSMLGRIIAEIISNNISSLRPATGSEAFWDKENRSNVFPLFGEKSPGNNKKH